MPVKIYMNKGNLDFTVADEYINDPDSFEYTLTSQCNQEKISLLEEIKQSHVMYCQEDEPAQVVCDRACEIFDNLVESKIAELKGDEDA